MSRLSTTSLWKSWVRGSHLSDIETTCTANKILCPLVGPSAPKQVALDRSMRYPTTIFSVPRPHYITPTQLSQSVTDILRTKSTSALRRTLALQSSELVVSPTQRPLGGGVGFFEQGILTGLGLFSISMLAGVSALGYWTWNMV